MKSVVIVSLVGALATSGAAFAQQARRPTPARAPVQPAAPAPAPTGRTAPYPEGLANAVKAQIQKGLVTVNKEKVVYTEEFMANSCLITVAQRPDNKSFKEGAAMGNGRISFTPDISKAYDECLASNGFAYQPKAPEKAKAKPRGKRRA